MLLIGGKKSLDNLKHPLWGSLGVQNGGRLVGERMEVASTKGEIWAIATQPSHTRPELIRGCLASDTVKYLQSYYCVHIHCVHFQVQLMGFVER